MVLHILTLLAVLAVSYFAAVEFQSIAAMKGHNDKKYFWWSFLGGAIGMLMVIALPDRNAGAHTE